MADLPQFPNPPQFSPGPDVGNALRTGALAASETSQARNLLNATSPENLDIDNKEHRLKYAADLMLHAKESIQSISAEQYPAWQDQMKSFGFDTKVFTVPPKFLQKDNVDPQGKPIWDEDKFKQYKAELATKADVYYKLASDELKARLAGEIGIKKSIISAADRTFTAGGKTPGKLQKYVMDVDENGEIGNPIPVGPEFDQFNPKAKGGPGAGKGLLTESQRNTEIDKQMLVEFTPEAMKGAEAKGASKPGAMIDFKNFAQAYGYLDNASQVRSKLISQRAKAIWKKEPELTVEEVMVRAINEVPAYSRVEPGPAPTGPALANPNAPTTSPASAQSPDAIISALNAKHDPTTLAIGTPYTLKNGSIYYVRIKPDGKKGWSPQ